MVLKQHDDPTLKFSSGPDDKKHQQIDHLSDDLIFVIRLKFGELQIKPSYYDRFNVNSKSKKNDAEFYLVVEIVK